MHCFIKIPDYCYGYPIIRPTGLHWAPLTCSIQARVEQSLIHSDSINPLPEMKLAHWDSQHITNGSSNIDIDFQLFDNCHKRATCHSCWNSRYLLCAWLPCLCDYGCPAIYDRFIIWNEWAHKIPVKFIVFRLNTKADTTKHPIHPSKNNAHELRTSLWMSGRILHPTTQHDTVRVSTSGFHVSSSKFSRIVLLFVAIEWIVTQTPEWSRI